MTQGVGSQPRRAPNSATNAFAIAKLVYVIDTELAQHHLSGVAVPDDVAEWLAGVDHSLWRLFAFKAGVPEGELTDALMNGVLDVYLSRGLRIRKAVRDAYEGRLYDDDAYEAQLKEVG